MENGQNESQTPFMLRVRTQTEVLVPLLRHLRTELGEEKANALVYPVLRDIIRKWSAELSPSDVAGPIERWRKTSENLDAQFEGDVEYDVTRDDDEAFEFNITGCRYAELFRQLDEPELGAILTCEVDDHVAELSAPAVSLSRATTLMKGGTGCPFRYRLDDRQD